MFVLLAKSVRLVPLGNAGVVERLGHYSRTLDPGLAILVPFIDRLRPLVDLKVHVITVPPQPVITEDDEVVHIDLAVYVEVIDAKAATYEVANYSQGVEQLTVTTLRNVVGKLTVVEALTRRAVISDQLCGELDEAIGKWGIRVSRVEIKDIEPPASVKEAMEEQMEDRLQQMRGVVTKQVDGSSGRIKLRGGVWSARTQDPSQTIAVGKKVEVALIDGATAVVYESEL
jgi:regulator of protease activity HflC (stomatin/prohibitin superfamily)